LRFLIKSVHAVWLKLHRSNRHFIWRPTDTLHEDRSAFMVTRLDWST